MDGDLIMDVLNVLTPFSPLGPSLPPPLFLGSLLVSPDHASGVIRHIGDIKIKAMQSESVGNSQYS